MIGELRLQGGGLSTEVSPRSPGTPNPVPVSPICRQVQEVTFPSACRRILLFFGKNSYFQNEVLVKEYVVSAAGKTARHDCLPACLEAAGGRWNRVHRAAPSHVPVALQATERRTPLPSSGRSTTNGRPTAARPTTTALTSSTGSVATTLPGQAGSLRWGPVTDWVSELAGSPSCSGWGCESRSLFPASSSWMTCGPMSSSTTRGRRRREREATGGQVRSRGCGRGKGGSRGTLADTLRLRVALTGSDPRSSWHHPPEPGRLGKGRAKGLVPGEAQDIGKGLCHCNEPCQRNKASRAAPPVRMVLAGP